MLIWFDVKDFLDVKVTNFRNNYRCILIYKVEWYVAVQFIYINIVVDGL